jgi:hypothetical protein
MISDLLKFWILKAAQEAQSISADLPAPARSDGLLHLETHEHPFALAFDLQHHGVSGFQAVHWGTQCGGRINGLRVQLLFRLDDKLQKAGGQRVRLLRRPVADLLKLTNKQRLASGTILTSLTPKTCREPRFFYC